MTVASSLLVSQGRQPLTKLSPVKTSYKYLNTKSVADLGGYWGSPPQALFGQRGWAKRGIT